MLGKLAAMIVRLWQLTASKLYGDRCRFYPSCSEYARRALLENGLFFGGFQAFWRLLRCAPWSAGGVDHVHIIGAGEGAGPLRRLVSARGRRGAEASRG